MLLSVRPVIHAREIGWMVIEEEPDAEAPDDKRADEKRTVEKMICIYCRGHHKKNPDTRGTVPCDECRELIEYAHSRIDSCPHIEAKTFCSACKTPCYRADMRERIRSVMAYAGPRMIFIDPKSAFRHLMISRGSHRG